MRTLVLIGLAGLTLAAGAADAQARARIRLGHAPGPVLRGHAAKPAMVPALAVSGTRGSGPTYVALPPSESGPGLPRSASATDAPMPAPVVTAPVPVVVPAKAVAEAAPWCRSGRVVGTGTGFCLIN